MYAQKGVGWQPSRFLTDRAEAERAFALAERLGLVNAAASELGTTWPLRKAFTRHGLGMPARNPQTVRQRAVDAARQRLTAATTRNTIGRWTGRAAGWARSATATARTTDSGCRHPQAAPARRSGLPDSAGRRATIPGRDRPTSSAVRRAGHRQRPRVGGLPGADGQDRYTKEGNCFTAVADPQALAQVADTLSQPATMGRLRRVCDRWIYSACLCFGLDATEQARSGFRYTYSVYQVEYSRNLLFRSGGQMDRVFNALVDRTRSRLDVPMLRTLFGASSARAGAAPATCHLGWRS